MFIINYSFLCVSIEFWCKIPEDGDDAETCRSSGIQKDIDFKFVNLLVLRRL